MPFVLVLIFLLVLDRPFFSSDKNQDQDKEDSQTDNADHFGRHNVACSFHVLDDETTIDETRESRAAKVAGTSGRVDQALGRPIGTTLTERQARRRVFPMSDFTSLRLLLWPLVRKRNSRLRLPPRRWRSAGDTIEGWNDGELSGRVA